MKKEHNFFEILTESENILDSASMSNKREVAFLHLVGMMSLVIFQNRLGLLLFSAKTFLLHFVFASRMEFVQRFCKVL